MELFLFRSIWNIKISSYGDEWVIARYHVGMASVDILDRSIKHAADIERGYNLELYPSFKDAQCHYPT